MSNPSFHAGERAVQERYGSRALLRDHEQDIRDRLALSGKVARYVAALPLVTLATRDPDGFPFVSLEAGPVTLTSADQGVVPAVGDWARLGRHLEVHARVGTVLVDFHRRLRFRIYGRGRPVGHDLIIVDIEHAFGNCRKHPHRVESSATAAAATAPAFEAWRDRLNAADRELLAATTHVCIATRDADGDAVRFSVTRVARVLGAAPWETRFVAPSSTFPM